MKVFIDRTGTVDGLEAILCESSTHAGTEGVLLYTCEANGYRPQSINPLLKRVNIPVAGGLFPGVFAEEELLERGSIALALPTAPHVVVLGGESPDEDSLRKRLLASGLEPYRTMLVLTDGMAFNATRLLDALFDVFGLEVRYLGGGAGGLMWEGRPCLLTNDGFIQGNALVIGLALNCGIGVAHGHKGVGGPHQVTAAEGQRVCSIDWRPAASYFHELVQKHLVTGENDTGGIVSRHFCLAINRLDGSYVIREPVRVGIDDSLEFAAEMRENELVDIVKADRKGMLFAAAAAREGAERELGRKPRTNLCFDCCARRIYLAEDFTIEIKGLATSGVPQFGAITVGGEIANNGDSYLDYYNRTCVVGAFEV